MTLLDKFELLLHGVQATRRHVEYLSCPICGGSGVRAQFYPHQLQNVQRILSATRVHHLIADEVGMGKTVQALMIANALRLQAGSLRVRIVVPQAELKNQWLEEIPRRAQCIPELGETTVGDDWFDVVDDTTVGKPSETLAPSTFDFLILDEPQSLKQDTLRFVAANSDSFPHLLLLTASPNLRDIRKMLEILQMLEPDRVERARRDADGGLEHEDFDWSRGRIGDLGDRELERVYAQYEQHTCAVARGQLDTSMAPAGSSEAYASFASYRRARVLAETRWKYRRVLRSYRKDFPHHLPQRIPDTLIVKETSQERERMRASLSYVGGILQNHRESEHRQLAAALFQRTALGGQSLQTRLSQLRRGEAEHDSRLLMMSNLSTRGHADSRLDALVDWLVCFWIDDPKRKVVIAAYDNVTVEELGKELAWRIPQVGPRGQRVDLKTTLATSDREDERADAAIYVSETFRKLAESKLRAFEHPDCQLLIAHRNYRQGFNLQNADALVFFDLPWKPEDVDQWIGRVDRLGRAYVDPDRPGSRPRPVHVVTLHRGSDPTLAVQEVLDEYRVFEAAIDPDRQLLQNISARIEAQALPASIDDDTENAQQPLDGGDTQAGPVDCLLQSETAELTAPAGSLWTTEHAAELHERVSRRQDLGPVLRQTAPLGYVTSASEEAFARWLNLLRNHGWINVKTMSGRNQATQRRSLTFYTLGQNRSTKVQLECLQDKAHRFPPFFLARGNIQRPPRTMVETTEDHTGMPRQQVLQFLSYGSPIHEDLVSSFRIAGNAERPLGITIYALGSRHFPNGTDLTRGTYLSGAGYIDPAFHYLCPESSAELDERLPPSLGILQQASRSRMRAKHTAGLHSDVRFLRIHRPPTLCCLAWHRKQGNRMERCSNEVAADLLGAHWHKAERPTTENMELPASYINSLPQFCAGQIADDMSRQWSSGIKAFEELLGERQEALRIEKHDRLWVLAAAIAEVEKELARRESGLPDAKWQATDSNYRARVKRLREECVLTERSFTMRVDLLSRSLQHIKKPDPSTVQLQCTAVVQMASDPVPNPTSAASNTEVDLLPPASRDE